MGIDIKRIEKLCWALSDAIARRAALGELDLLHHHRHPEEYAPAPGEESELWNELTDPANYAALEAYWKQWPNEDMNEFARGFCKRQLETAKSRTLQLAH